MFWFILIVVVFLGLLFAWVKEKAKSESHKKYQASLKDLEADPRNAVLRQRTLALGRTYSNLMRDNKGNTVFDEVALMNDINAACAGAPDFTIEKPIVKVSDSVEARLEKLLSLKERKLINDSEYISRRKEILESI